MCPICGGTLIDNHDGVNDICIDCGNKQPYGVDDEPVYA
jgi:hypothetical protein